MKISGLSTLKEALAVLNHFKHRKSLWHDHSDCACPDNCDPWSRLEPFEALAIAEKYLRDYEITLSLINSESTQSDNDAMVSTVWHIKVTN